jgi:acyl-CoA dehydrogenase
MAAVIRATAIAGAGDRLLDLTTAYANERVQFGKPIGRQQAIQQQLAVMAEHAIAARIAAQMGCAVGLPIPTRTAAMAKVVASLAVTPLATIAHAVHGAIGISEEYQVQLYTRRLHEWRIADGSERYWSEWLGSARIASNAETSIAFLREEPEGTS